MNDERGARGGKVGENEKYNLRQRSKAFALRLIHLYAALPQSAAAQVIGKQLLRSGTSVGAHYREAVRARSPAEFVSKLEGGIQELEETIYWLELLIDGAIVPEARLTDLLKEADELMAILVSSAKTVKAHAHNNAPRNQAEQRRRV